MGRILRRPRAKSAALAAAVHTAYGYERLGGRRRLTTLRMPGRRDALGTPATEYA